MTERHLRGLDSDAADAAIDRAVRELMNGEPAPGFRQRVFARLEDEPRATWMRSTFTWPRLGFAAVTAAIVLALALWMRPVTRTVEPKLADVRPQVVEPPQTAPVAKPVAPATPLSPRVADRQPAPPVVKPRTDATAKRVLSTATDRRVAAANVTPVEEALERAATKNPAPIVPGNIAPLNVRPLETPEIIVRPLTVGPLMIVPLLPPR
jgi:hypothetical protein